MRTQDQIFLTAHRDVLLALAFAALSWGISLLHRFWAMGIDSSTLQGIAGFCLMFPPLYIWKMVARRYRIDLGRTLGQEMVEVSLMVRVLLISLCAGIGLWQLYPVFAYSLQELRMGIQWEEDFQSRVEIKNDDAVLVYGFITNKTVRAFVDSVNADLVVKEVRFDSRGGVFEPALELAVEVGRRNLRTANAGICYSACTIPFLASHIRILEGDGEFGFHALSSPGASQQLTHQVTSILGDYYLKLDVEGAFVRKAISKQGNELWKPTVVELFESNYISHYRRDENAPLLDFDAYCKEFKCS